MAKELPYFKFEPAEYLTKDISFCSLSAQGLFINICSYYWQRGCQLTKEQLLRRLNHETELEELIGEGVIDLIENNIFIKFLDNQLNEVENKSKTNSVNGSKGGRPKKNRTETETKPNENPNETETISETKGIREDKIRLDEIKEDEIREDENITASPFSFYNSLINYGFDKNLVSDWLKVRKVKNASNNKTAFKNFISEIEKRNVDLNEILEFIIVKNWRGFSWSWYDAEMEKEKNSAQKEKVVAGRQTMETIQQNLDTTGLYVPSLQNK